MRENKLNFGFTYIELIITIAIMSLLVTASTFIYLSAQADSRDSRRKSDLAQVQLALEAYKADNNTYPDASLTGLTNGNYIEAIPSDPGTFSYDYVGLDDESSQTTSCGTDCQTYRLMGKLEAGGSICGDGNGNCDGGSNTCNYCLTPFGQQ